MKQEPEIYQTRTKQWRWRIRARNGRIIANAGEAYHNRKDCLTAIALLRKMLAE